MQYFISKQCFYKDDIFKALSVQISIISTQRGRRKRVYNKTNQSDGFLLLSFSVEFRSVHYLFKQLSYWFASRLTWFTLLK